MYKIPRGFARLINISKTSKRILIKFCNMLINETSKLLPFKFIKTSKTVKNTQNFDHYVRY